MKKTARRRVAEDVEENPRRVARRALREREDDAPAPKNRPEGLLVKKLSDTSQLRAEMSDYTGEEQFVIQRWVKTKKAGWVRTKARLGVDPEHAHDLAECIAAAAEELVPRKKRRK